MSLTLKELATKKREGTLTDTELVSSGYSLSQVESSVVGLNVLDQYAEDQRDFSGIDLNSADLSGADLIGVNLSRANLSGADLSRVNLSGANLRGADLSKVNLSGANLRGADLSKVNLSGANLGGANLIGVDLTLANVSGANLGGANLSEANLYSANLQSTNLQGANLELANLIYANLLNANFSKASLQYAILSYQKLQSVNLSEADLTHAALVQTKFSGANLTGAILKEANLKRADLANCDFTHCNLNEAIYAYEPAPSDVRKIKMVVLGDVGSGKSTFVGNFLYKIGAISKQVYSEVMDESGSRKAWLMDKLEAERESGMTMEVTSTTAELIQSNSLTLFHTPGHRDFIKKTFIAISQADYALLVVSASIGEFETSIGANGLTKKYIFLAHSLGIKEIIVAVSKMDNTEPPYSENRFDEVSKVIKAYIKSVCKLTRDMSQTTAFIPISGLHGDNIIGSSEKMPWFKGWERRYGLGQDGADIFAAIIGLEMVSNSLHSLPTYTSLWVS